MPLSEARRAFLDDLLARPARSRDADALPRVVVDTNVMLDIEYWRDKDAAPLARALFEGRIAAIVDEEVLREYAEVLDRPAFGIESERVDEILERWVSSAERIGAADVERTAGTLTVRCRDPLDQKFLVLAVAGGADLLFTKDKLVLKAGKKLSRFGVRTLKPEAALDVLEAPEAALS